MIEEANGRWAALADPEGMTIMRIQNNKSQWHRLSTRVQKIQWHRLPACGAAALAAGLFLALPLSTHAQPDPRPDRALIRPPHFEAIELERLDPPPGFERDIWQPWSISDDGTVYGFLDGNGFEYHKRSFASRPNEGTWWLIPGEPDEVEVRPIAPSTSGVVLLYAFYWPEDWVHVPRRGTFEMNGLHGSVFFPSDMNNHHVFVGQVGIQPNNRAVTWSQSEGFNFLHNSESHALRINDRDTVVGHVGRIGNNIAMRVWYADGSTSDFNVPALNGTPIGVDGMNNRDETVGTHWRYDGDWGGWAGWFWSEETGYMEIPVLHTTPSDNDVFIFGISDAGWVLGCQSYFDGEDQAADYFLWHADSGFFPLRDLYNWRDDYYYEGEKAGGAAMNASGQIAVRNRRLSDGASVIVFLDPIR